MLPHRDGTFDHRRPLTTLEHLRDDEARAVNEADDTHVDEILRLHDVARDPGLASHTQLERVDQNLSTRSMHHHVFDTRTAWEMVAEAGWTPVEVEAVWPHDIVLLAVEVASGCHSARSRSPFPTDRRPPRNHRGAVRDPDLSGIHPFGRDRSVGHGRPGRLDRQPGRQGRRRQLGGSRQAPPRC